MTQGFSTSHLDTGIGIVVGVVGFTYIAFDIALRINAYRKRRREERKQK